MDRRDRPDDVLADDADREPAPASRSLHLTWVKAVTIGLIMLFVLATIVGALL